MLHITSSVIEFSPAFLQHHSQFIVPKAIRPRKDHHAQYRYIARLSKTLAYNACYFLSLLTKTCMLQCIHLLCCPHEDHMGSNGPWMRLLTPGVLSKSHPWKCWVFIDGLVRNVCRNGYICNGKHIHFLILLPFSRMCFINVRFTYMCLFISLFWNIYFIWINYYVPRQYSNISQELLS